MAVDEDLELLMGHLGDFGQYQLGQFLLHILAGLTAGLHMLTLVTVAAIPDHRCAIPDLHDNFVDLSNNFSILETWIPKSHDGSFDSCHLIEQDTNTTVDCVSWVYDTTYHKSSRGIEWDFVCGRRWMSAVSQSTYMFGVFTGAVILGTMADKYGRKPIFYFSAIMQLLLGVGVAFVPEFYTFLFVTFFYGIFGSAGAYIAGFVLTMELVGPTKRTVCGITFQAMFALGIVLVALWGYVITDRVTLQVVYGLHSLLLIGHWWLIDESPRWLWSQGRIHEAVRIVDGGVRMNGRGIELDKAMFVSKGKIVTASENEKAYGITDMFRTPNMRAKSLNVCLNWFANSLVYYGLSLNTGKLNGNPYLLLGIIGLIEIPSYVMSVLLLDKTGRRCLTSTLMILGGLACLMAALIPKDMSGGSVLTIVVVFAGKFCIAGSFAIIYNYSAELFPTVVRNTGMGVGSMCARLSGALTPLITLLDSFDKRVPTVVFALVALVSGALTTLLPETMDQPMPQSLEDGEKFRVGDTCFTTGCFGSNEKRKNQIKLRDIE